VAFDDNVLIAQAYAQALHVATRGASNQGNDPKIWSLVFVMIVPISQRVRPDPI
jgi:hypothetical protein